MQRIRFPENLVPSERIDNPAGRIILIRIGRHQPFVRTELACPPVYLTKSQMFPPPKISQPSHFQIPSLREATILNSYERVSSFLSFFFYALLLQTSTAFRPFFDPSHSVAASETGRRNHFPLNHRATHASIDLHANAGAIVFR